MRARRLAIRFNTRKDSLRPSVQITAVRSGWMCTHCSKQPWIVLGVGMSNVDSEEEEEEEGAAEDVSVCKSEASGENSRRVSRAEL